MTQDLINSATKGVAGMIGAISAKVFAVAPWQDQTSWWLGAVVAIGSAVNIGFDIWKKWSSRKRK